MVIKLDVRTKILHGRPMTTNADARSVYLFAVANLPVWLETRPADCAAVQAEFKWIQCVTKTENFWQHNDGSQFLISCIINHCPCLRV